MSNIDKQALNQEKIEWLNKLADMEYCKSNPGHWLMSLKDTNMLAKLALRSVALLDELEAAEKRNAELEARTVTVSLPDVMPPEAAPAHYWGSGESMAYADGYNKSTADLKASFAQACSSAGVNAEFE
ncbi:hypothetical protein ACJVEK_16490 [Enterobacter hormaechei subsp. xiangfangensis]|uniref:hypothetical protein n=1 Tax=Enterobacter hormaechei TaxID=158836 RepID=UPI003DA50913